jgi:glutamyl-tRNA synthetase
VKADKAYYAFDRPEELESMRVKYKTAENPSPQYDHRLRMHMRNSLSLTLEETERLLQDGTPHVIRIKVPENETVSFTDMIRGEVSFQTANLDDKVLLKGDGMPTYHLAVVVDDYLMKISHAFRGEEWLPSAPIHVLLWRYIFGENKMPKWAHFPLILKPDGNGKLSKRDGDRLGFPVFAMDWKDPRTNEFTQGFKQRGFLPQAFVNMLAALGWNDGTEKEIFSLEELIEYFSIERVHKHGAKFDYEKAKWFNHEWIKRLSPEELEPDVLQVFRDKGMPLTDSTKLKQVIGLIRERCTLLPDFYEEGKLFFQAPQEWDLNAVKPKWTEEKKLFFGDWTARLKSRSGWTAGELESAFKDLANEKKIKAGELQLPLRIMLVGEKKGPPVFEIASLLGTTETIDRIGRMIEAL